MKTLITLCTYNEAENLKGLIPELLSCVPDATILVIDDNSPDGTGQLPTRLRLRFRLAPKRGRVRE